MPATASERQAQRNLPRVVGASAVSGVGDGALTSALPLLAAALTREPIAVAAVGFASTLPWLVVGLVSGALVDRWDRRRVMIGTDAVRCVIVLILAATIAVGAASIPLLMVISFALGVAETLFDNAEHSIIPSIVGVEGRALEKANSFLQASDLVGVRFLGPALGGWLFALAHPSPFLVDATSFSLSALVLISIGGHYRVVSEHRPDIAHDIADGLKYLVASPFLRNLALAVGLINLVAMAQISVLVLLAVGPLGFNATGYGFFLTAGAFGSLVGTSIGRQVKERLGLSPTLILAIATNGFAAVLVGISSGPFLACIGLALGALSMVIWNVITLSLRQRIVPMELLGRVNSAYRLIAYGSIPVGALIGGAVARLTGIRMPFVLGGLILVALALTIVPRMISTIDPKFR